MPLHKFYPDCPVNVFAIEGIDALGKSTLINNIKNSCGFYQVIHFSKPEILDVHYLNMFRPGTEEDARARRDALYTYQAASFNNSMLLATSGARLIFDRWHLGEDVYAPMYRKYDGSHVFDLEKRHELQNKNRIRLILLTENFELSNHFQDDGLSLGSASRENRAAEQERFLGAFNRSIIKDKRIICVTDPRTGKFRDQYEILQEALSND